MQKIDLPENRSWPDGFKFPLTGDLVYSDAPVPDKDAKLITSWQAGAEFILPVDLLQEMQGQFFVIGDLLTRWLQVIAFLRDNVIRIPLVPMIQAMPEMP